MLPVYFHNLVWLSAGQLVSTADFDSEGCRFDSHGGYIFIFFMTRNKSTGTYILEKRLTWLPLLTCVVTTLDLHSELLGSIPRGVLFFIQIVRYSVTLRVFQPLGWYAGYSRKKGMLSLGSLLDTKQKKQLINHYQRVVQFLIVSKWMNAHSI